MPQAIVILPTGGGMQLLLCYDSKLPVSLSTCGFRCDFSVHSALFGNINKIINKLVRLSKMKLIVLCQIMTNFFLLSLGHSVI